MSKDVVKDNNSDDDDDENETKVRHRDTLNEEQKKN